MDSAKRSAQIKDKDLFKAAESGDSSLFESLTEEQLLKALSLRNEDARSLFHVAVSSAHTQVVKILTAADPSASGINSGDEEGCVPLHSAASSGNMEILLRRGICEGQSTTRPPLFDGTNYTYWKERMRIFIKSNNFLLWQIIKNGEQLPTKKVEDKVVLKTENEYDAEDIKKVEDNAKAIDMLCSAVNPDDYRKISCCTTAKQMWEKLEVTYEGTDQVREAKIDFLTHEYELFRMKENEKIDEMFERFSKIVYDLHALKKTYTDRELVRKILRSLTLEWRSKADAIRESIGITNVTIDGLRWNLKTYESTILNPPLDDQRKRSIALKVSTSQPQVIEDSSDEDNAFGLVIKKFHKFMRKEYERKGKRQGGPPKCYGCGEVGNIKPKCPNTKTEKKTVKKQRAYISWGGDSGDESSDGDEDETVNLCVMAHEEAQEEVAMLRANVDAEDKEGYTVLGRASNDLRPALVDAAKTMLEG